LCLAARLVTAALVIFGPWAGAEARLLGTPSAKSVVTATDVATSSCACDRLDDSDVSDFAGVFFLSGRKGGSTAGASSAGEDGAASPVCASSA
jgi:hypothetical protein